MAEWGASLFDKGLKVNTGKSKVIVGISGGKMIVNSRKKPNDVCGKGVQANSVNGSACQTWIHIQCSGVCGDFSLIVYGFRCKQCDGTIQEADLAEDLVVEAPNDIAYTWWSCHIGQANPVQIVSTTPAPSNGGPNTVFWASRPCRPAGWLAMHLIKAGDVETNPGPTTTHKQVWIGDICHRQIQVRKQISIRCNRIEH